MKYFKIAAAVISAFLMLLFAGFVYIGGFLKTEVTPATLEPTHVVYIIHRGGYQDLGKSWQQFQKDWQQHGLADCEGLAIYLDKPETPDIEKRTILACDMTQVSPETVSSLENKFKSLTIPEMKTMMSSFPYKNFLSFMFGAMKTYPKLQAAVEGAHSNPTVAIEKYGMIDNMQKIDFHMPMNWEKSFFEQIVAEQIN